MKKHCFVLCFLLFRFPGVAQKPGNEDWIERLKNISHSQFTRHYSIFRDITQLDSAPRIRTAIEIEKECAKGNRRLKL